jgi:hypothetical protein
MRRLLVLTALAGALAGVSAPASAACVSQGTTVVCVPPGDDFSTECSSHHQFIWCRVIDDVDELLGGVSG